MQSTQRFFLIQIIYVKANSVRNFPKLHFFWILASHYEEEVELPPNAGRQIAIYRSKHVTTVVYTEAVRLICAMGKNIGTVHG